MQPDVYKKEKVYKQNKVAHVKKQSPREIKERSLDFFFFSKEKEDNLIFLFALKYETQILKRIPQ